PIGPADLVTVAGDPEQPGSARGDGLLLKELTPDAVRAVVDVVTDERLAGVLGVIELRQLGGALGRPAPAGHGALASVEAGWAFFAGGSAPDATARDTVLSALGEVRERLAPWTADQVLLNASAGGIDPAAAFTPDTWERLQRVRDAYDPDRVILATHDGPPAA
ncbi:MAG TPA: hypothetical protein VNT03_14610, partial [Baekduia sp.]|nr:hypothetical protein [Baekduia sp.]